MRRSLALRLLQVLVAGYVLLALVTRIKEAAGTYTCGCDEDCWCKTPGLSVFRWVFPRGHKNRSLAQWKATRDTD
ncbi:MAG: hypothetical protein H0W82_05200 [Actinobacteria bacterium]|nr:hypothetical protein [Actinomycetota bacterium]